MSDSEIFSLNSSVFTRTTGCTVVTGPVAQRTRNIQSCRGERVPSHQAPIPIRRPCLPNNSGNATQPLAFIFLPHVSCKNLENAPGHTRISRESVHRAMGIEEEDDDLAESDNNDDSDPIYHNLDDEARLDPKAAADAKEDDDELESEINPEGKDKVVIAEHLSRRQIRSDIHSQISVILSNGCEYFRCNPCTQQYKRSAGTKNIRDYLLKRHGWTSLTGVQNKRKRENESIKDVIKRMRPAVAERRDAIRKELLSENLDKKTLEYFYIQTVIQCDLPFSLVQNHTFRTWLQYVNSVTNDLFPNSGSTIWARIMSLYEEGQRRICLVLQEALSSIHISCDGWTTPDAIGIFGIVGHFTDEEGRLQALLLAMVEVEGAHTGEQLATQMFNVLDQYHIKDCLGYFVMDNATANDCMVTSISEQLFETDGLSYDSLQHCLRYNGHIINLSVQAFLFGSLPEEVTLNDREGRDESLTTAELKRWRKMGPLGKLHNIVVYIKASPQRTRVFLSISGGKMVRQDNGTRWNSWYEMLDWTLSRIKVRKSFNLSNKLFLIIV